MNKKESQRRTPWKNGPQPRQQEILNIAMQEIKSVPYNVTLRWLFYRLYGKGFYANKKDYNTWISLSSRARHTYWNGWDPDILADDTREMIARTGGYRNEFDAVSGLSGRLKDAAIIYLDHFYNQENYIEIWFEARAMIGQFKYYTKDINLVPMGGQTSIRHKWNIAKNLDLKSSIYGLPIIILYFGDEDLAGHVIQEVIELDVNRWSDTDFKLIWCGLTEAQAKKYEIPESVKKKGYQWEALSDEAAGEIITDAIKKYISIDVINETNRKARHVSRKLEDKVDRIIEKI